MSKKVEMLGTVWGDLTVIAPLPPENGRVVWLVECGKCKEKLPVRGDFMRSGHTRSHDCERAKELEVRKLDLIGKTFGELRVLSAAGTNKSGKSLFLCQCSCGSAPTVIVGSSTQIKTMVRLFSRLNRSFGERLVLADTLDQARTILLTRRQR